MRYYFQSRRGAQIRELKLGKGYDGLFSFPSLLAFASLVFCRTSRILFTHLPPFLRIAHPSLWELRSIILPPHSSQSVSVSPAGSIGHSLSLGSSLVYREHLDEVRVGKLACMLSCECWRSRSNPKHHQTAWGIMWNHHASAVRAGVGDWDA